MFEQNVFKKQQAEKLHEGVLTKKSVFQYHWENILNFGTMKQY